VNVDLVQLVLAAAIAGAASSMATVLVLKVDMRWIKRALARLERRTDRHDVEIRQLQQEIGR
jgi:hypothetical protein